MAERVSGWIRPMAGVPRQDLVRELERLALDADNARSVNSTAFFSRYLQWARDCVVALSSRLVPEDLDRLVMTRRYWLLHSVEHDRVGLRDMVDLEFQERAAELRAAAAWLNSEIERWDRIRAVLVVADTSVYISDPERIELIPWRERLGLRDEAIHLLVPMVIVDELDGLKRSSRQQARWRASLTLAVIDKVILTGSTSGRLREREPIVNLGPPPAGEVTCEIVADPPGHSRLPINDDEIVDRALAIQAMAGRQVRMLTYDTGMSTRARFVNLDCRKLEQPVEPQQGP